MNKLTVVLIAIITILFSMLVTTLVVTLNNPQIISTSRIINESVEKYENNKKFIHIIDTTK